MLKRILFTIVLTANFCVFVCGQERLIMIGGGDRPVRRRRERELAPAAVEGDRLDDGGPGIQTDEDVVAVVGRSHPRGPRYGWEQRCSGRDKCPLAFAEDQWGDRKHGLVDAQGKRPRRCIDGNQVESRASNPILWFLMDRDGVRPPSRALPGREETGRMQCQE